jgi:hypothetical protein
MLRISANYKDLESYTVHRTAIGTDTSFQLDEISIVADPKTLKALAAFFMMRRTKWSNTAWSISAFKT